MDLLPLESVNHLLSVMSPRRYSEVPGRLTLTLFSITFHDASSNVGQHTHTPIKSYYSQPHKRTWHTIRLDDRIQTWHDIWHNMVGQHNEPPKISIQCGSNNCGTRTLSSRPITASAQQ